MKTKYFVISDFQYVEYIGEHSDFESACSYTDSEFPFSSNCVYDEELLNTMLSNAQDALERSKQ